MVSDKVTYCCQTLLWTAKKTRTMSMTNFIDQKLFAKCKMHFCMQWLLEWQLFYIGVTPVVKSSGGADEMARLLVCPKSVDDDDCMHALTGWRGVNCSLSLALSTFAQMSPLAQSYKWRKLRGVALPPYKGVPHTLPPLDDPPTSWFHLFFWHPDKTGCVCVCGVDGQNMLMSFPQRIFAKCGNSYLDRQQLDIMGSWNKQAISSLPN